MNTSLALIRACAQAEPGDFLPYLVAADHFDDPDEGDDKRLARTLRWMAEHQKYPHIVTETRPSSFGAKFLVAASDGSLGRAEPVPYDSPEPIDCTEFKWYSPAASRPAPDHARLPDDVFDVLWRTCPNGRTTTSVATLSWLAAVFALAAALPPE